MTDIEGLYQDVGETIYRDLGHTSGKRVSPQRQGRAYLAGMGGFITHLSPRPRVTVEFAVIGTRELRVIVREGKTIVGEKSWAAAWDDKASAWILQSHTTPVAAASSQGVGAGVEWDGTRLMKGNDGQLYLQAKRGTAGLLFIFPTATTTETWSRWEPLDHRRK
jgi:hypothetical protein